MNPRQTPRYANSDVQARTWLKPEQVEQLRDAVFEASPDYLQDRDDALIALLYDTGLRRSEAVSLDVGHFDPDAGTLYLPGEIQKGNVPDATLELGKWGADSTRVLRRYLRDRWKDTDALFPSRSSDRMAGRSVGRMITKVSRVAAVTPQTVGTDEAAPEDVSPHTLRHSVAYRIIQAEGGRLEDVQMRLRHADRSTTDRIYSHLIPR